MEPVGPMSTPRKRNFCVGILGSGFIGDDCHLVSYRRWKFNTVAIASRTKANAARVAPRHGISKVYDRCEQLLDDPTIEVLEMVVIPDVQFDLIRVACGRRTVKGILAQKPLAMNLTDQLVQLVGLRG